MRVQIALLTLLTTACSGAHHDHAPEWTDFGDDPMANPAFMDAMVAAATPGEPHAELAKGVGSFDVTGWQWVSPDAPPEPVHATAQTRAAMGGRYLIQEYQSDFAGMPFEGMMLMGFDNVAREYWTVWIDNFGTGCMMSRGVERPDGRIELLGTVRDLLTPGGRPFRSVTWHRDDGSSVFEMHDSHPDGSESKVMELIYTKQ